MEGQNRRGTQRAHLAQGAPRDARGRPRHTQRDLRQRPGTVAGDASGIPRVLRNARPAFSQEWRDLRPQPTACRLRAPVGLVLPPRHGTEPAKRLELPTRAAKRRTDESNSRLWRRATRPRDERETSVRSPAAEPHQQRLKNVIGVVREEHRICTRLDRTCLERSKPKLPRARGDAAPSLRGMHMDSLKRNTKLRTETRTVIGISIGFRTAQMVMHMHRARKSWGVSSATPRPCEQQERRGVHSPAEGDQHAISPTDPTALVQRCACAHARACAPHKAPQSAIGGVHHLMLRRFALGSADDGLVRQAVCDVLRQALTLFRRLPFVPQR